jgi:lipoprotein Spr
MTKFGDAIAARARGCVGVRFRPQGREVETGLDCVGLAAVALRIRNARGGYALRGGSLAELEEALAQANLRRVKQIIAGDVLVLRAGPEQLHLCVVTNAGFVHADAGLRRVVERPEQPPWPVLGIWRLRSRKWRR